MMYGVWNPAGSSSALPNHWLYQDAQILVSFLAKSDKSLINLPKWNALGRGRGEPSRISGKPLRASRPTGSLGTRAGVGCDFHMTARRTLDNSAVFVERRAESSGMRWLCNWPGKLQNSMRINYHYRPHTHSPPHSLAHWWEMGTAGSGNGSGNGCFRFLATSGFNLCLRLPQSPWPPGLSELD